MPNSTSDQFSESMTEQHSECRIMVYSHVDDNKFNGIVNCSNDVISCSTSKTIKSGGGANFTLVPRINYINYIFPNDYVYIWFNPGGGRGFMLTFFGFVDRVERSISVTGNGTSETRFTVICSDFTKAFDVTNIYFNPHIANREDFVGMFAGTRNLGGAQLRTRGIVGFGTPGDIVHNLIHILLGWGSQFVLPRSHPKDTSAIERNRKNRVQLAHGRLPGAIAGDFDDEGIAGALTRWLKKLEEEADTVIEGWHKEYGDDFIGPNPIHAPIGANKHELKAFAIDGLLKKKYKLSEKVLRSSEFRAAMEIEASADPDTPYHLLDLIDFSFFEYLAIDGSLTSAPIWTQQGTLWSLMNSYSNEVVNELFCDLRALGKDYRRTPLAQGGYSTEPQTSLNDDSLSFEFIENSGINFVPAIVMREYPFSTAESLNGSYVEILERPVNLVWFRSIFSKGPNIPGRKVNVFAPALHDYYALKNPRKAAVKHIDVHVIRLQDIISENVGRSDHDVVNLLEIYSEFMNMEQKFMSQDVQPVATPISVYRHGLRVRSYSTKFARFSKKNSNFLGIDNFGTRHKLARWALLLDHWYQHNIEYLNGTITTRALPELRVGYRLDIVDRRESYYVEGVAHNWSYPGPMTTTITVSRGQRNDPFPVYVKPQTGFSGMREEDGRLATFFRQKDVDAIRRGIKADQEAFDLSNNNAVDDTNNAKNKWANYRDGYLVADESEENEVAILRLGMDAESEIGLKTEAAWRLSRARLQLLERDLTVEGLSSHPARGNKVF